MSINTFLYCLFYVMLCSYTNSRQIQRNENYVHCMYRTFTCTHINEPHDNQLSIALKVNRNCLISLLQVCQKIMKSRFQRYS